MATHDAFYSFTGLGRGKYAEQYKQGTNLVALEPDIAEVFANNDDSVNEALRLVIELRKILTRKKTG